jgi:hypothetical protein
MTREPHLPITHKVFNRLQLRLLVFLLVNTRNNNKQNTRELVNLLLPFVEKAAATTNEIES